MGQDIPIEFSICLMPDDRTTKIVNSARNRLPPSPFRDDTPHLTLLRGIKINKPMDNAELIQSVNALTELSKALPLHAIVRKPATGFSFRYRFSSGFLVQASPRMLRCRKNIIKDLKKNHYRIDFLNSILFIPHISIRLGVPHTKTTKKMIRNDFWNEKDITFHSWIILKVVNKNGKRLMDEIGLSN